MAERNPEIEMISVSALIPYARNSRTHSKEQVAQIAASIREFGFTNPVLIDDNSGIIAGHGRVLAAQKLGIDIVPCIRLSHLTETQKRAYVVADNRLALNAGWDEEMLSIELKDLAEGDFDLGVLGFDSDELSALLAFGDATQGLTDPDEMPALQEQAVSMPGDIWVMGNHRLMCGDSTSTDNVAALLAGAKPHIMVTDPPYGVEDDPEWRNRAERATKKSIGARATGIVLNDDRADWREAWALFPGEVAYVWHAGVFSPIVADSLIACDFELRALIVWAKHRLVIGRGHYHHMHEPCWYAVKQGGTGHWHGDRKQTTVWQIEHSKSDTGHGTQKPVEAMRRPIINSSAPGDSVYEPFSGSGTTLIACEETARRCYAMELSPQYVDVAVRRWQQFSGKKAVLESNGKSFHEVQHEQIRISSSQSLEERASDGHAGAPGAGADAPSGQGVRIARGRRSGAERVD